MKLIWLTDPHFQLDVSGFWRPFERYVASIAAEKPDAVLLGGDLCNRASLGRFLTVFRDVLKVPIFYVLGNHEYFGLFVADVRTQMDHLARVKPGLAWLFGMSEPAWLTDGVALVGADTWGDARVGNLAARNLRRRGHEFMYDQIEDIRLLWESCRSDSVCIAQKLQSYLRAQGDEAASHLDRVGRLAAESARQVLILTHAPPFREATLYKNKETLNGLPFFCSQAVGDVIKQLVEAFPAVEFTVLSGHTHCGTDMQLLPRLRILVHEPGGKGIGTRWAALEVDSRRLILQKPDEIVPAPPKSLST